MRPFGTFILLVILYSFFGAVAEHLSYYGSKERKLLANPILTGFPLYAIGAYLVVGASNVVSRVPHPFRIPIEFITYGTLLSALEYASGRFVGAGTNSGARDAEGAVVSWDYSKNPYHYQGIVDLRHFILFGLVGLGVARVHPILRNYFDGC